jgi:hypothetical protein
MTFTTITLTDADSGLSTVIRPRDGVAASTLDVQPAVRVVSDPVAGGDGTRDRTLLMDAAAVTLSLVLYPAADGTRMEDFLDELAPLLAPWRRPALICDNDRWDGPRQLTVRFDSKTGPVDNPDTMSLALSWKAPAGCWTAVGESDFDLPASFEATTGMHMTATTGLHMAAATGLDMPASNVPSASLVTVGGSLRPPWVARLYGPCTGPKLANDTTGQDFIFTNDLILGAGQYVELDSAARTANLLSDPSQSQLNRVDYANSQWWTLEPGLVNVLRYHPTSGGSAGAVLTFREAWMA